MVLFVVVVVVVVVECCSVRRRELAIVILGFAVGTRVQDTRGLQTVICVSL